jgi:hypothetical protein
MESLPIVLGRLLLLNQYLGTQPKNQNAKSVPNRRLVIIRRCQTRTFVDRSTLFRLNLAASLADLEVVGVRKKGRRSGGNGCLCRVTEPFPAFSAEIAPCPLAEASLNLPSPVRRERDRGRLDTVRISALNSIQRRDAKSTETREVISFAVVQKSSSSFSARLCVGLRPLALPSAGVVY